MTPHSFREALDRLEVAVGRRAKRGVITPQQVLADRAAARQEVERLYAARVGEEFAVAERDLIGGGTETVIRVPCTRYQEGDRVFVTKGEAG